MAQSEPEISRRGMLGALALTPALFPAGAAAARAAWSSAPLPPATVQVPVALRRSLEGRSLSRFRYHNAEAFFTGVERDFAYALHDRLYQVGIVLQLGISSHLLDIGFDDQWCAHHIGLDIAAALALANATGLDHHVPELVCLAALLSPYGKWRIPDRATRSLHVPFSNHDIAQLTRDLLDRVRASTGHPRARGWQRNRSETGPRTGGDRGHA